MNVLYYITRVYDLSFLESSVTLCQWHILNNSSNIFNKYIKRWNLIVIQNLLLYPKLGWIYAHYNSYCMILFWEILMIHVHI